MYEYKALVTRVVDGDTFDATVELGFGASIRHRFRLKAVDTPETWRPVNELEKAHGEKATIFVKDLIEGKTVTITSVQVAAYSRYDGYVTLEDGRDLGQLLIENELVKLESYE